MQGVCKQAFSPGWMEYRARVLPHVLSPQAFFGWEIGTSEERSLFHDSTAKVKRDKNQRKTTMKIDEKGGMRIFFADG